MGTIACTVNGLSKTLTVNSISGMDVRATWARFQGAFFEISGGGSFQLAFTAPYSTFQFDPHDPIDWGSNGQPSWIAIQPGTTAAALTLQADSSRTGTSVFTIRNADGESIEITLQSAGGSGGNGGTVAVYLQDHREALVGEMPAGALAGGRQMVFGLRDAGEQEIFLSPGEDTVIRGLVWHPALPDYIQVAQTADQITISVDNTGSDRQEAVFAIHTDDGTLDPTVVTNPDESAP